MSNPFRSVAKITWRRHGREKSLFLVVLIAVCFFACCPEAYAGPGGQFVKVAAGGIIVFVLLLIAGILLLPLILYFMYREAAGIRRTKRDLALLAARYPWFDWPVIRDRIEKTVRGIAVVWESGDLSSVASFITPEYFGSQQQLLQRWIDEGKEIVYRLERLRRIEPLAVQFEDKDTPSWIRVKVTLDCTDYMRDRRTREVVMGQEKTTTGFEAVWHFIYRDQEWLLNGIEEGSTILTWACAKNQIDTSYLDTVGANQPEPAPAAAAVAVPMGTNSQTAARDPETSQPAAQPKQRLVRKPADDQDQ